jgi:hypothetical protein
MKAYRDDDTSAESTLLHSVGKKIRKLVQPKKALTKQRRNPKGSTRNEDEGFEAEVSDPIHLFIGLFFLILIIFALSPGVLLTLPPGRGKIWMSGTTSTAAAFVHAVLLVLILYLI